MAREPDKHAAPLNVLAYNSASWDRRVQSGDKWTLAATAETIAAAKRGAWAIILTPTKAVPRSWFPPLVGCRVLSLGGGGGQQSPILAAAGAIVTTLDASAGQLAQDRLVAERDGLSIRLEQGNFADLSRFADASFDLIVHPTSNLFAPDVRPVWRECFRVLVPGGRLMAGFVNPILFAVKLVRDSAEDLKIVNRLPYADLSQPDAAARIATGESLEWGHTLEDQIAGQIDAGFRIVGFYEDTQPDDPITDFMSSYIATLAEKP
jgi:2-polyprenyl-3-methyl-5-hydroxy-6-metoxy-1,4-benzoquinol methylase